MTLFLYSNCIGSYVFDESFKVVDKAEFKDINKLHENSLLLEKGLYTETEEALIKKHKDIVFLGFKSENKHKIKFSHDVEKLSKVSEVLKKEINQVYKINLLLTKVDIRYSVKNDNFILQAINNIEDLNKVINTLAKRLREWYELYNPEFSRSLPDHEKFVELIIQKNKKELLKEIKLSVAESMGADLAKEDIEPILELAKKIKELYQLRESQKKYLEKIMKETCPNLTELAGALIGAKLIEIAGDLKRLSMFPASTVQLLGAEKALFRHITKGAKAPKYGIIFQHPLVARAKKDMKGKVARALANKLNLAIKMDVYGEKKEGMGKKMLEELEAKFK